ncbi:MAG: selenide, water dikinase SelD [Rhodobacterales bacterium 32-66-7]|nr:MAG: selenide, water dikinase SelD [Rhodobacterales bacterium 32-66-7]
MTPHPQIRDLVLIGGGHAHALVARGWGMDPLPGTRLTLINPDPVAPYTGMLPGLVAGHYRREELMIDLVRLARFSGARLILDRATGIDPKARLIHLADRPPLAYDLAAVDIGITSDLPDLPGAADHAVAAKPLGAYAARWEGFLARRLAYPRVVILGAGLGGVELALATAHRLKAAGVRGEVTLLDRGDSPMPDLAASARRTVLAALQASRVTLQLRATASRPKAGVFAVRAAPILLHNLRASLSGGPLRRFKPQSDYLKLVSLGAQSAVASKWGITLHGPRFWQMKDRIDRAFMQKFGPYPAMAEVKAPTPATKGLAAFLDQRPLCGGCGAKLGPGVLSAALDPLPPPMRAEVLSGPRDDAAILRLPKGVQVLTTDHLRAFSHDPRLMARLAALHALGDIWAMGAVPQVALAQVTLPRLGPDLQTRMLAEIMAEAAATFRAAGADVVGGHSSEGAELTIGFTVTGTAETPVTKTGARPGDALILTKPLGSGIILAAEMAMAQSEPLMLGEVWAACIAQMSRPQGSAAAILVPHARAMTDVTGFGLAGHLLELLTTAATLQLPAIPLMPGAAELAEMGQASSLQPANQAAVSWRMTAPDDPRVALLTDPQTCGGLLAAVPAELAAGLVAQLKAAGHDAALIGSVTEGAPHLTITA